MKISILAYAAFMALPLLLPAATRAAESASLGNSNVLSVPCDAKYLRKCSDVLSGVPDLNGYKGPKGIVPALEETVKRLVDAPTFSLYQGYIPNLNSDPLSEQLQTGKPVCNPVPNTFNGNKAEIDFNHNGESCGMAARFEVNASRSGIHSKMIYGGQLGTRDFAYFWGAKIQAYSCYLAKVRKQILTEKKLTVSKLCDYALEDFKKAAQATQGSFDETVSELGDSGNLSEIVKCDPKTYGGTDSGGIPLIRASKACAGRANLEAFFQTLALCEVRERANKDWRTFAADANQLIDFLKSTAVKTCNQRCVSQCRAERCTSPLSGASGRCSACGTRCANQCYPGELARALSQKFVELWPNDGGCKL